MIHFLGNSYAAVTLKEAARRRGLPLTEDSAEADLIFVSEDTPTDEIGNRDLAPIRRLIDQCLLGVPVVITSQVTPGFCRSLGREDIYHQAETLRIEDGIQRAMYPEMFIVGAKSSGQAISKEYLDYLESFECPILNMSYEDAEFCKIAINATLISQVETANMLSKCAERVGADWGKIAQALRHDSRIGKYSYLTPGHWQNSKHLLRDYVTLKSIDIHNADVGSKLLDAWK